MAMKVMAQKFNTMDMRIDTSTEAMMIDPNACTPFSLPMQW